MISLTLLGIRDRNITVAFLDLNKKFNRSIEAFYDNSKDIRCETHFYNVPAAEEAEKLRETVQVEFSVYAKIIKQNCFPAIYNTCTPHGPLGPCQVECTILYH